jgi:hypothetical protein
VPGMRFEPAPHSTEGEGGVTMNACTESGMLWENEDELQVLGSPWSPSADATLGATST